MERTISLLIQAAAFIELEARDLEMPGSGDDHLGRPPKQRRALAETNKRFAKALRDHIAQLENAPIPTLEEIARDTGMTMEAAKRAVSCLVERGIIVPKNT